MKSILFCTAAKLRVAALRSPLTIVLLSTLLLVATYPALAQTETVLQRFTGTRDGANYTSPLTPDGAGNFYGTTDVGGKGLSLIHI